MVAKKHRTYAAPPTVQEPLFAVAPSPARVMTMTGFSDRAYQLDAVGHVVGGLRGGGRGQLRAACGTGKTKMAQWSADRLVPHGGVVVIVVPTVGLVAQTLAAWAEGDDDHRALAVCSDDSVVADNYGTTEDILEPVTTDSDVIDAWLRMDNTSAVQLIVGTHISAHVIGAGLQKAGAVADLLVIDEAHRSSGWIGKQTALLHDDEVLPAARRLYMTATPRVWDSSKASSSATYSMDDERVFGPVLYNYPFSRAIDEGYLDDYRLVVIGVTRAEVLAVLRNSERRTGTRSRLPDEHTAMVQAATARAAAELGLRRVIAFCPLVEDAKRFAETFQQTIDAMPPELRPHRPLHAAHVQGNMKQTRRREILATLAEPPDDGWTVIANARCLSEGIDVPTVDGIAFTAPKKSPTDIVQAVGRALRRDPEGSGTATIIVPILLADDDSDDDDETIDAGSYEVLWQVVRGLRAHDDTFGGVLDSCRGSNFTTAVVQERLQFLLPETHRSPQFVEHLTIRLVKSTTSKWWDGYRHLAEFHAREGHSRVSYDHVTDDDYNLGDWVGAARVAYKQKRLAPERIEALRKLDFVFDARAADWERGYRVAADFYAAHGHLRPPNRYRRHGVTLAPWLGKQRAAHGRGTLPADRKARLDELGMQWATTEVWQPRLAELRAHHTEHGYLPNPKPFEHLSGAMGKIRAARKRGELDEELIAELDAMGMPWDTPTMDWWDGYRHLADFHDREGHTRVPQTYITDSKFSLGTWVSATRVSCRNDKLEPEQVDALQALGFVVDPRSETWERSFTVAAAFYTENGHLHVPAGLRIDGVRLGDFVRNARLQHARGTLTADRKARLDELGMQWETAPLWEDRVPEVRAYYAEHGQLPERQTYTPLAGALNRIRAARKRGELDEELIAELDAMGMVWQPPHEDWWDDYAQLAAFHQEHGHCEVPRNFLTTKQFQLGLWCSAARTARKDGKLEPEHVAALQKLGFSFDRRPSRSWEDNAAVAEQYAAEHGDLLPPKTWRGPGDLDLHSWLARQRTAHANGTLAPERVARLDAAGMDWTPPPAAAPTPRARLEDRLSQLRDFYTEHGHLPTVSTDKALVVVLTKMRAAHRKGTLPQHVVDALDDMGIVWKPETDWWDNYAHLAAFHAREGHCRFSKSHVTAEGFTLGAWATSVRAALRNGTLPADRAEALEKIGFAPDAHVARWEHAFSIAEKFAAEHGHLEPNLDYRREDVSLGPWLYQQRKARAAGTLDPAREARLTAIGMRWQHKDKNSWDTRLAEIQDYYATHGRLPSQKSHPTLGKTLSRMRTAHRKGTLAQHLVDALDAMGIVWDTTAAGEAIWERGLAAATRFHLLHGHLDVRPSDRLHSIDDNDNFDLSGWLKKRRIDRSKGKLTDTQVTTLDALNMIWNVQQSLWEHSYTACAAYYAEHGHLRVPTRYTARNARGEEYRLVTWINTQRGQRHKLTADQILMLDKIGMDWDPFTSRWENNLVALQEFHDEHGHLDIPPDLSNDEGVNLSSVLTTCRTKHRQGTLDATRTAALDALGIDWEPGNAWERVMEALRTYYTEHGDILVPPTFTTSKGTVVADWLTLQRKRHADGKLTDTQIAQLNAVGMIWQKGASKWARTMATLTAIRERYGDLNVTHQQAEEDPEARKVYHLLKQYRTARANGTLPPGKISDLDALGIDWDPTDARERQWQITYEHVAAYHDQHGDLDIPPGHTAADGTNLQAWLTYQKTQHTRGKLATHRAALLDILGIDWPEQHDPWDRAITECQDYIRTVGPLTELRASHVTPSGFHLYAWIVRHRRRAEQGELPAERVAQLRDLGALTRRQVTPKPKAAAEPKPDPWPQDLAALRRFHAEYGDINVSRTRDATVGAIVTRLRAARRAGTLPADRAAALDALGIDWEPRQTARHRGITAARSFYATHGHLLPPQDHIGEGGVNLYAWVVARRGARTAGTLTEAEIAELDAIGMVWDLQQATWDEGLAAATAFHTAHGHLDVPVRYRGTDLRGEPYDLAQFLHKQRSHRRAGTLPADRAAALDVLGIDWNPHQSRWETNLATLRAYYDQHGHIALPTSFVVDGIDIGKVISRARRDHANGTLPADRAAALDALGIIWSPKDTAWQQMIEFLTTHHAKHGHLRFPKGARTAPGTITSRGTPAPEGIEVDGWLTRQRNHRLAGDLTDTQIADLDALGMVWEKDAPKKDSWRTSFTTAQRFHQQHGHLDVPAQNPHNTKEINALYAWVCTQRRLYQEGTLAEDRIALLETLGMQWNPIPAKQAEWLRIFDEVRAFREQRGHFTFGRADKTMIKLGKWLEHQKALYHRGELKPDRAALLTGIGMDWRSGSERAWDEALARLRTYRDTEGDPNTMRGNYKSPDGFNLYDWLRRARAMADAGDLPISQVHDLLDCGVHIGAQRARRRNRTAH